MGKNQKNQRNEQLRELREKQKQEAVAKKKREQRLFLMIGAGLLALIMIIIGVVLLVKKLSEKSDPLPQEENYSNYVSLTVKYTDNDGQEHTGDIIIELDPSAAPITVKNFQKLVSQKFYDGLIFHRVIENFMIQGGDPKGDGTGGSDQEIKGEFSANGVNNPIKHERGVISMARNGVHYNSQGQLDYGYNTASSQFFIVHETYPSLDGQYAAFGRVLSGMEFVDGIATMATNSNDKPLKDAIIVEAKLIEKP